MINAHHRSFCNQLMRRTNPVLLLLGLVLSTAPLADDSLELMKAAAVGNITLAKTLLEKGANVKAQHSSHAMSPLMVATLRGRSEMIELLVQAGANVNLRGRDGATAANYMAFGWGKAGPTVKDKAMLAFLKSKGGTITDMDIEKYFKWLVDKPLPPKCFSEFGEVPPCGRSK